MSDESSMIAREAVNRDVIVFGKDSGVVLRCGFESNLESRVSPSRRIHRDPCSFDISRLSKTKAARVSVAGDKKVIDTRDRSKCTVLARVFFCFAAIRGFNAWVVEWVNARARAAACR
jgi:hypothetical protein